MFDWKEYLELAEQLAKNDDEASHRTAVSRAYYAIFNFLKRYARLSGKFDVHNQLISTFKNKDEWHFLKLPEVEDSDILFIGNELSALRSKRNNADYDAKLPFSKKEATDVCQKVRILFEIVEQDDEDE